MSKIVFVVEMVRNDTREEHSYVCAVYDTEFAAVKEAWEHIYFRAQKYGAIITSHEINNYVTHSTRQLYAYGWNSFKETNPEWAEKIQPELFKE